MSGKDKLRFKDNEIDSKDFIELFKSKKRLNCAGCGGVSFGLTPTRLPNTTIDEAVNMTCLDCGHKRLELVK